MDKLIKNILTGAAIQVGPKTASHLMFNALPDVDLRKEYPWWYGFGPFSLPIDDYVTCLGIPAILLGLGYVLKNGKVKQMAIGAALTGGATFINNWLMEPNRLGIPGIPLRTAQPNPTRQKAYSPPIRPPSLAEPELAQPMLIV